jgi:hypothetical protein
VAGKKHIAQLCVPFNLFVFVFLDRVKSAFQLAVRTGRLVGFARSQEERIIGWFGLCFLGLAGLFLGLLLLL